DNNLTSFHLFSSAFRPVCQKLRLSFVRQRVIEQLVDHLERYRRDVCAYACGFDHVNRMPETGGQYFGFPGVVPVNLNDAFQQQQTVFTDVIETTEKRADKRSARLCGKYCLRRRETERDVYFNAFVGQLACRFQALARQRAFDDDVWSDLRILASFAKHAVFLQARHFRGDGALHDLADRGDVLFEVDTAFLRDQRGIGGHAVGE